MTAKIKLQRKGTKSKPAYRLVIQQAKTKSGGKVVEILGEYNPRKEPTFINFKKEEIEKWLKNGAQPTEKVRILLGKAGILPPVDTSKLTKRKPKKEAKATEGQKALENPA